jgi:D-serine deaminase-like pyridoxal phosphate-dependent protein
MIDIDAIETPSVLIDRQRLVANIGSMQDLAGRRGVTLRPHVKTHKSLSIARMQIEAGATGITASKPDEALTFIHAGFRSITLAYPIVERRKIERVATAAAMHDCHLRLIADSQTGVDAIGSIAGDLGIVVDLLLKIDVGLHRCGVREADPALMRLAGEIASSSSLRFAGILSHAGHAYGARSLDEVREIASEECAIMNRVHSRLADAGIDVEEVSVGSTPTVMASDSYEGITEIRPGNYVFMDRTQLSLGVASIDRIALTVLATVVSVNSDYTIIDAGSKVLSSDLGAHGTRRIEGYGIACSLEDEKWPDGAIIEKLSEEHGFIGRSDEFDLHVGSRVRVIPNHSCVVANLSDRYVVLDSNGSMEFWPVDARGCVR